MNRLIHLKFMFFYNFVLSTSNPIMTSNGKRIYFVISVENGLATHWLIC